MKSSNIPFAVLGSTFALLLAIVAQNWLTDPIRIVLALPLLFFWPGYLTCRALHITLPPIEITLVSLCLSIALCVLGSFVLYAFSNLTPIGWGLWLLFVILASSFCCFVSGSTATFVIQWPTMRRWHIATLALAGLIACSAYVLAIYDAATTREFSYTEFWLIPSKPGKLIVGVKNMELEPESYDVSVTSRNGPVAEYHSVSLNVGETWTRVVDSRYKIEATLYLHQNGRRVLYRHAFSAEPEASDAEK